MILFCLLNCIQRVNEPTGYYLTHFNSVRSNSSHYYNTKFECSPCFSLFVTDTDSFTSLTPEQITIYYFKKAYFNIKYSAGRFLDHRGYSTYNDSKRNNLT